MYTYLAVLGAVLKFSTGTAARPKSRFILNLAYVLNLVAVPDTRIRIVRVRAKSTKFSSRYSFFNLDLSTY